LAPLALQGGYRARSTRGSTSKSGVVERCKRSAPQLRTASWDWQLSTRSAIVCGPYECCLFLVGPVSR
jgi:hypothetical protein